MELVSSLSSLTIYFHIIETVKAMDVHSESDIKVRVRYQLAQNKQLTHLASTNVSSSFRLDQRTASTEHSYAAQPCSYVEMLVNTLHTQ